MTKIKIFLNSKSLHSPMLISLSCSVTSKQLQHSFCVSLAVFIPSSINSNVFDNHLRYAWCIEGFVKYLGGFRLVCDLGVCCFSYKMSCGMGCSGTILWIRRTISEHPISQLILYEKSVVKWDIPKVSFGSREQFRNIPFRKSFYTKN